MSNYSFKGVIMDLTNESLILDTLLHFDVPVISDETRFWMIRTQKGYFYNEFLAKSFVALAWNNIDRTTDFSDESRERLKDDIMINFSEINRPSTVVNKCIHFISDIKVGDILVIPSRGSQYITFASAGEYFEDTTKTVELEKTVIERIQNNDVDINDVSCPYKKRRHITLLRTIKSENINYALYRAISNYHGISNFDSYAIQILNHLYNCYSFKNDIVLVYNIRKNAPIKPRELSSLIYCNTECLSHLIPEENIATQLSLHSPGDNIYILKNAYEFVRDNWNYFFGLLVVIGGGSVLTFKVPGLVDIIKNILNAPSEIKEKRCNAELKELEVLNKRVELYEKITASGIDMTALSGTLENLCRSASSLEATPIELQTPEAVTPQDFSDDTESDDTDE